MNITRVPKSRIKVIKKHLMYTKVVKAATKTSNLFQNEPKSSKVLQIHSKHVNFSPKVIRKGRVKE